MQKSRAAHGKNTHQMIRRVARNVAAHMYVLSRRLKNNKTHISRSYLCEYIKLLKSLLEMQNILHTGGTLHYV